MYIHGHKITEDFLIAVQLDEVPGVSMVHKYGRNDAVPNGSWAHLSLLPFATSAFRQSPVAMRIKSGGNAADDAAGNGARSVFIQGIDSTLTEVSEEVASAGASASSATSALFWRVHHAWVGGVGTYGVANTAAMIIEDSGGGANFIVIAIEEGQTQYTGWSIPTGKEAYLLSVHGTVDAGKAADVRLMTRQNFTDIVAPMSPVRLKRHWDGVLGGFEYKTMAPSIKFDALTDIWFEGKGDGAITEISCNFELLVFDV